MAIGIGRPRLRADGSRLFAVRALPFAPEIDTAWLAQRGEPLFEATADLFGGFPGYADHGAVYVNAQLRITTAFLLVDEAEALGFGVPTRWIEGVSLLPQAARDEAAILVRYHDGYAARSFRVRFRTGRVGGRGTARPARAMAALQEAGVPALIGIDQRAAMPFAVSWAEARAFEAEDVIWTGGATAPVHIGGELVASDAWLTTRSLIWGSGAGSGINRVPLPYVLELVTTRRRDRIGTPALYLSVDGGPAGRLEVPFVFDRQVPPDHNFRDRGAMLAGLEALGIPDGEAAPTWQPWRSDPIVDSGRSLAEARQAGLEAAAVELAALAPGEPEAEEREPYRLWPAAAPSVPANPEPEPVDAARTASAPGAPLESAEPDDARSAIDRVLEAVERADDTTDPLPIVAAELDERAGREDVVLAIWTAEPTASAPTDDLAPATDRCAGKPEQAPPVVGGAAPGAPPPDPWAAIRRYEEMALTALDELFRAIDRRAAGRNPIALIQTPPSTLDQARALSGLVELQARGEVDADAARRRRERILGLGDICVRLRTLVELHAAGYVSDAELGEKRKKLVDGLSIALVRM